MNDHLFLLKPGRWVGEGKIILSMTEESELPFSTSWTIPQIDKQGKMSVLQEIQVAGLSEPMHNHFSFYDLSQKSFCIELENQSVSQVIGKGMISEALIGWEFRLSHLGFEGFEFYELAQEPDTYFMHAEYAASDDFRTILHGKIWRKLEKDKQKTRMRQRK